MSRLAALLASLLHRQRPPLPRRIPTHHIPAAPDNTEGLNLALADQCERLWNTPHTPQTGLDMLRREIRNQQRKDNEQ